MSLEGKTIFITGSTDGVGRWVAGRLAAEGARLLVHGRDRARGEALVETIAAGGGKAVFLQADLASLAEARRLAEMVKRETDGLDVLVNNAGVGFGTGERQSSADGHELRFAVNYLAGFLIARLLIPELEMRAPSRIVNVASAGQQAIDFSDVMLEQSYDGVRAYRQSKLAEILFTIDLAEELEKRNVTVNALHPATFMDTTMVRAAGLRPASTVEEGGEAIVDLVASPALEGRTGLYFNGKREARADPQAYDPAARKRLRALSFQLCAMRDPLASSPGAA